LCLLNSASGDHQLACEPFDVVFRELDDASIERYLQREQPYDCAGSFRMEGLGISLFQALRGDDPYSLIGLPLIRLCAMLRNEGVELPCNRSAQLRSRQPQMHRQGVADTGPQLPGEALERRLPVGEVNHLLHSYQIPGYCRGTGQAVNQAQLQGLLTGPDQSTEQIRMLLQPITPPL